MDSTLSTSTRPITSLKPHPLNAILYEKPTAEDQAFRQLLDSVRQNGILQPLVIRNDGTILSGHRRHAAALSLGLCQVPVQVKEGEDDRVLLVEYNRYRHKSISELMREAELIESVVAERAAIAKARPGMARDESLPEESKVGRTDEIVSASIGMKARTFNKAKAVYEAAKTNENAKEKLEKLDRGEMSIDAAYKAIRTLLPADESKEKDEIPEFIRFYTSWQFSENDPRFGIPHPGRIPGQISANVIWYFTQPGDLVVDPMAGGGSTLDAAEFLGRRSLGLDVVPRRPDIQEWDISKGFPEYTKGCDLIFMDPPYWNMKDEGYSDLSSSRLSLEGFTSWYRDVLHNAAHTVRPGGFVAVIIMSQFFRLPEDIKEGYIDWPIFTYNTLVSADMLPWSRICVTQPTSMFGGFDIESAKEGRYLLPNVADVVVMRKPK
jgi:ParB-like chromosome segregation protein Spo0J